eukprot:COSAG03_NODE_8080_length_839_cov_0.859459_1_plen_112_part_10
MREWLGKGTVPGGSYVVAVAVLRERPGADGSRKRGEHVLDYLLTRRLGAGATFARRGSLDTREETRKVQAEVCATRSRRRFACEPTAGSERNRTRGSAPPLRQGFVAMVPTL